MMKFVSEELLEDKIKELEDNIAKYRLIKDPNDKILHDINSSRMLVNICKKELAMLRKLKVDLDMTGTVAEFESRVKDNNVYLMTQEEYNNLIEDAYAYRGIEAMIYGKKYQKDNRTN